VKDKFSSGELIHCLPDWEGRSIAVYPVYRSGMDRINRVKAVMELALETLPHLLSEECYKVYFDKLVQLMIDLDSGAKVSVLSMLPIFLMPMK